MLSDQLDGRRNRCRWPGPKVPASSARAERRRLILDEVARYPLTCGREGSARSCLGARTDRIMAKNARRASSSSTPVELDGDPFSDQWLRRGRSTGAGLCRARHCGASVDADVGARKSLAPPRRWCALSVAVSTLTDPTACALLEAGQWRPTVRGARCRGRVSYHLPRWCSPASTLTAIAADHHARHAQALPGDLDADLRGAPLRTGRRCSRCWPATGEA